MRAKTSRSMKSQTNTMFNRSYWVKQQGLYCYEPDELLMSFVSDKFLQYYKPFDVFVPLANDKTRDTTIRGKKLPLEDQSNRITSHTTEEETMRIMKARPKKPPPGYEY